MYFEVRALKQVGDLEEHRDTKSETSYSANPLLCQPFRCIAASLRRCEKRFEAKELKTLNCTL